MNSLTLNGMSEELHAVIRQRADREGLTLNDAALRILEEATIRHQKQSFDSLSDLAGTWTKEEADEFDRYLADQRTFGFSSWS